MTGFGIHWFRRDLRLKGNPALLANLDRHRGRVLGLFIIDPVILSRGDFSVNRFGFLLETLVVLSEQMKAAGGELLVLDGGPENGFKLVLSLLKKKFRLPESCSWNRDYEPFAIARDLRVEQLLRTQFGTHVTIRRDHLLIEPEELSKPSGKDRTYRIYTPFARRWFELFRSGEVRARIREQGGSELPQFALTWKNVLSADRLPLGRLDYYRKKFTPQLNVVLPPAGYIAAKQRLLQFKDHALQEYADDRDLPAKDGTSRMSVYLKNGSISISQIIGELGLVNCRFQENNGRSRFLKELVWREFYYHILFHFPRVEQKAFNPKFEKLKWAKSDSHFQAWTEGRTGYPIVDAGMRQLRQEGWMHNRVRMIVASFLTKDLLISWQRGEEYFMKNLLDGDLASNNGGWQWAASTGCDPQPYFRIFNPKLQGERFDPEGEYVKRYIPELRNADRRWIHEPGDRCPANYPAPIVNHAYQKTRALIFYDKQFS